MYVYSGVGAQACAIFPGRNVPGKGWDNRRGVASFRCVYYVPSMSFSLRIYSWKKVNKKLTTDEPNI